MLKAAALCEIESKIKLCTTKTKTKKILFNKYKIKVNIEKINEWIKYLLKKNRW